MSRFPRLVPALALVAVALLPILAACAAPAPASPTAAPPKSVAPTAAPAPAAPTAAAAAVAPAPTAAPQPTAAVPTPKPVPTGILRVGASEWGSQAIDPLIGLGSDLGQMPLVFDWLVGVTPDQSDISNQTGLANKWDTSADGLIWTFGLRKGVTFDQGYGEATAEDVKFSIERTIRQDSLAAYAAPLRTGIKAIEVVDPYTVRFVLNKPMVTLAYDLSPLISTEGVIVPKKYIEKVGDKEFSARPVGSGPYRLQKAEKGISLAFEGRDDYWGGAAKYKQLILSNVPEEGTRVAMLKTGQLDVAAIDLASLKELESAGFKMTAQPGAVVARFAFLSPTKGALADARVREAINLAINSKEMLQGLFDGRGEVMRRGVYDSWAVGAKNFDPVPYNPSRAKELLAQAGYASGLELTIDYISRPPSPLMSQAAAGYLEAVGIKTKLASWDNAARNNFMRTAEGHTNHMTALSGSNKVFPIKAVQEQLGSKPVYAGLSLQSSALDALIAEGMGAKDINQYSASVGKIQQYLHDNWSFGNLLQLSQYWASNSKIDTTGWKAGGRALFLSAVRQLVVK